MTDILLNRSGTCPPDSSIYPGACFRPSPFLVRAAAANQPIAAIFPLADSSSAEHFINSHQIPTVRDTASGQISLLHTGSCCALARYLGKGGRAGAWGMTLPMQSLRWSPNRAAACERTFLGFVFGAFNGD